MCVTVCLSSVGIFFGAQVTMPGETANQCRIRVWKEAKDRWKDDDDLRQAACVKGPES